MGNTQICENFIDDLDILNGSANYDEKGTLDKNYKISSLLDFITNDNNFNFKINLKCNENKTGIENLNDESIFDENEKIKLNNKNHKNINSKTNFINFNSLGNIKSTDNNYDKNLIKTFSKIKEQQEKILNGNILKVAFIGRHNYNHKLLNTFFINEKNPLKTEIYSSNLDSKTFAKEPQLNYKSKCFHKNISNSFCFFSNADYIDFSLNYFISYHKGETFDKDC